MCLVHKKEISRTRACCGHMSLTNATYLSCLHFLFWLVIFALVRPPNILGIMNKAFFLFIVAVTKTKPNDLGHRKCIHCCQKCNTVGGFIVMLIIFIFLVATDWPNLWCSDPNNYGQNMEYFDNIEECEAWIVPVGWVWVAMIFFESIIMNLIITELFFYGMKEVEAG